MTVMKFCITLGVQIWKTNTEDHTEQKQLSSDTNINENKTGRFPHRKNIQRRLRYLGDVRGKRRIDRTRRRGDRMQLRKQLALIHTVVSAGTSTARR